MIEKIRKHPLSHIVSSIAASVAVIEEGDHGGYIISACNNRFADIFCDRTPARDERIRRLPVALDSILQSENRTEFVERITECFTFGEPVEFLHTCMFEDPAKNWRMSLKPLLDKDGRISGILTTAQNVTKKKLAEKQITLVNSRFSAVVEAAYDGIITINQQSRIILFNQAAQKLFGYAASEIIGEPIERLIPDEFRARHGQYIATFSRGSQASQAMSDRSHVLGRHKDGTTFPVDIAISKLDVHGTVEFTAIVRDASERLQLLDQLAEKARTDHLTGLLNRREFDLRGRELFEASASSHAPLSLLMLDLDHFKRINDTHGHDIGDDVLRFAARLGVSSVRSTDIFARLGGEEFGVLMPGATEDVAREMAERIRGNYQSQSSRSRRGARAVPFTVSIGTATMAATDSTLESLLKRADKALYRAKNAGRNQVAVG
ncbi:sensor domain-containing diguanylate cyclase [Breoghania sp. L-A4]|uniref:sensor domain-containing diguanylate cyclase n=1 Tax=Breoghania sp. L-A4 TaxID=2304600 RepID=UPI0013C33F55|nr:sensor domain-containing diguanylate cyclase [Breoghania sp. L-A4]